MKEISNNATQVVIDNIKKYRKLANMSQKDLSLLLGKDEEFITKMEDKGMYRRLLTIQLIDNIAKIFNIPIVKFFDKNDNK